VDLPATRPGGAVGRARLPNRCAYCSNTPLPPRPRPLRPLPIAGKHRGGVAGAGTAQATTREVYLEWRRSRQPGLCRGTAGRAEDFNASLPGRSSSASTCTRQRRSSTTGPPGAAPAANFRWVNIGWSRARSAAPAGAAAPAVLQRGPGPLLSMAREHSISVRMFVILAARRDISRVSQTVDCLRRCRPATSTQHLLPVPGTDLYDLCRRQKLLRPDPQAASPTGAEAGGPQPAGLPAWLCSASICCWTGASTTASSVTTVLTAWHGP